MEHHGEPAAQQTAQAMPAVMSIDNLKRAMTFLREHSQDIEDFYYVISPAEVNLWDHVCQLKQNYPGMKIVKQEGRMVIGESDLLHSLSPWPFLPSDSKPTR